MCLLFTICLVSLQCDDGDGGVDSNGDDSNGVAGSDDVSKILITNLYCRENLSE